MFAALLSSWLALLAPEVAYSQTYVPIPPGFDFPADQATLERFRDTENVGEMRRHAWYVFAGLTQPAPGVGAVWETWYSQQEVFSRAAPESTGGELLRPFEPLRQLQRMGALPEASEDSPLSFVLFNQEAKDFIQSKRYNEASVLDALVDQLTPQPPPLRQIDEFDRKAVGLKLVFRVISATQPSIQPVWDGMRTKALEADNPPSTWPRVVVIDPTRPTVPMGETRDVTWHGGTLSANVVGLEGFYHFTVTAAQLAAIRQIVQDNNVAVGDHVILTGMHFTTKEIPDWVWATFWWHDKPSDGPFGADIPSAVQGVWRNFRMDVAYSTDLPLEYDSTPKVAFNPYIESFAFGSATNCMACHQQARWPKGGFPDGDQGFDPSQRGKLAPDDGFFDGSIRTDFLWAIPFLAN